MKNPTKKWIRAGLETIIHGGAAAVSSTVAVNIIDPHNWGASWKTLQLIGATFAINGGLRFFQWWQNNPLPPENGTAAPFPGAPVPPTPQISLNPLSQVQPLVQQPTVEPPRP